MRAGSPDQTPVVLVTGPSGAGRITAIRVLEDLGFEAIDNLPLSLIKEVVRAAPSGQSIAIGVDIRTRGFSAAGLMAILGWLRARESVAASVLYLDATPETLLRRFSETRRRHPFDDHASPDAAIAEELELLSRVRDSADTLIDTSDLSPHELKTQLATLFGESDTHTLSLSVQSFSYKRGIPHGLDMVLDCRFLQNPHWVEALRPLTGQDVAVATHVQADPNHDEFLQRTLSLLRLLIPAYRAEGKAYFSIGFGCTGGRHRSVYMTERVAKELAADGWLVSIRHREMERRAGQTG
ncbi:RNase adapter RapZ [Pontivivens insulae]|uniref:Nucleotide-binding protein n=1 Tax=Pontivivens insulae TaxID=1639689 RepID=A0A2R8ABU8_9RHOB|nr:RNase adapter RapZ [Pontivivens insulae]RED11135.1 UPF0042 nucleotide-binding protein [Pontivivens insulae]SPF29691.1 Nucleotide-binding protein [Pontivivens insulae]